MICPNCGTEHEVLHPFCCQCGAPLSEPAQTLSASTSPDLTATADNAPIIVPSESTSEPIPEVQEYPVSPAQVHRKGRHWPPAVIMAALVCCGLLLFWLIPFNSPSVPSEQPSSCFSIQNGVLSFHEEYYTGSSEVTIPSQVNGQTVTAIGKDCFYGCSGITTVILPDTVTTIQQGAFNSCRNLRGIQLPESITIIGDHAFQNCPALEAICIGSGVNFIGKDAFSGCINLNYIIYSGSMENWFSICDQNINDNVEVHAQDGTCKQIDRP